MPAALRHRRTDGWFSATRSISVASAGAKVPLMSTISGKRRNTAFDGSTEITCPVNVSSSTRRPYSS